MAGADRPLVVTMGDPAGIGPEIIVKALAGERSAGNAIVVGDAGILAREARRLSIPIDVRTIAEVERAVFAPGILNVVSVSELPDDLPDGQVDARAGAAAFAYVVKAVAMISAGLAGALVTAPINKASLKAAGVDYPGHTEILAALTDTENYAMMLYNDQLRVVLVTIHLALRDAIDTLTIEREVRAIRLAAAAAGMLGIEHPRVAVAGLNPHAGEDGRFGNEETEIIAPAVAAARQEGIAVSGPWPGDVVFRKAREGAFDIVVAQYHDQGLIPIKYAGIDNGVNVTVGLPFIRTSVDHGTAFDIAGTGTANHTNMRLAIEQAFVLMSSRAGMEQPGGATLNTDHARERECGDGR